MNDTGIKEPHEIQLALPPFRVTFYGYVEPSKDEELISQSIEEGEPVETSLVEGLYLTVQKDGRWEDIDSSEHGEIEPGDYVLTSGGLFSVPDNQAVLDR